MLHHPSDTRGWLELTSPRTASSACTGPHHATWLIVGAGFTGLSCARRLAQLHPDDEIILLEARQLAQGASGRNSGVVVANSHFAKANLANTLEYERVDRINSAGLKLLADLVKEHKIDCQWQQDGFYYAAADRESRHEHSHFVQYLEQLGIPYASLEQAQIEQDFGTQWYQKAVHLKNGALMHPAKLVHGLADSLPPNVRLFENSAVQSIDYSQSIVAHTQQATIKADKLVLAVNYEAGKLGHLRRRLLGSTLSGSMTRVLTEEERSTLGKLPTWAILSLHNGGATVRLNQEGRLSIRNTAEYRGGVLLSDAQLAKRQQIHRAAFDKRFPALAHVPFEIAWSGVEGISGNSTNFFQQVKPNCFLAGGYNGSGVSRGTAFGHALAEYASGEQSNLINDCLASPAAQWLPPRPILDIGAWFTVRSRFKGVGKDR